jgi:uncharacterized membrane protein YesL
MGFFTKDYDKPGRGVSKNEPEKRGFFRFFELFFRSFWKLISCELWYVLLSLPLLTKGLAEVGYAYVCRMAARDKHVFATSDFFEAIKKNWRRALPLGIINLLIEVIIFANLYVLYIFFEQDIISKTWGVIILAVTGFIFAMYSFAKYYQYTLMITFDFNLKTLFKNSWLFATLGIKHNLIIGGVMTVIYLALYSLISVNFELGVAVIVVVGVFLLPAFRAFLIQFNVFPEIKKYIIDPYYNEHPDEDIEKRRNLGLLDDDEEEDESVFEDKGEEL